MYRFIDSIAAIKSMLSKWTTQGVCLYWRRLVEDLAKEKKGVAMHHDSHILQVSNSGFFFSKLS